MSREITRDLPPGSIPISALNISARAKRNLQWHDLKCVFDLVSMSRGEMLRIPDFGIKQFVEVQSCLQALQALPYEALNAPAENRSLRDQFAMAPLTGILAHQYREQSHTTHAIDAYAIADAMIAAREKER